jgi:hypothetical protein
MFYDVKETITFHLIGGIWSNATKVLTELATNAQVQSAIVLVTETLV